MTRVNLTRWLWMSLGAMFLVMPMVGLAQDAEQGSDGLPEPSATSALRDLVARYATDRATLLRRHDVEHSAARRARLRDFYQEWQDRLDGTAFDRMNQAGRVDYVLLRVRIDYERQRLAREEALLEETSALLPFRPEIEQLEVARRDLEPVEPEQAAALLARLTEQVGETRAAVERGLTREAGKTAGKTAEKTEEETAEAEGEASPGTRLTPSAIVGYRAAGFMDGIQGALERWFRFHDGYDPSFSWWVEQPYGELTKALDAYQAVLRRDVAGIVEGEEEPIIGDPIGRDALLDDLAAELIPYTPEELLEIAEREFAWCEREMIEASRALGHGDDWQAALEQVKAQHLPVGEQPRLVKELADEAVAFLEAHDLVTVPPLAREVWRMEMLSPEQQRVAPFFLGGEVVRVAYPTDTMSHDEKLMSLRGNNVHFSRAVVHHELIPGHHLQGFMTARYNTHRQTFRTPFWTEGWALYWEMLLWDLDFPKTPEDRIGMLFWRMHRAARIMFSLGFHLGQMTPQECIDFLVERVGHERSTAEGEVRRSFRGDYPPLYQLAYMIGGLQFRALHEQLVGSGEMSHREFHDAILREGAIPVEMARALLTDAPLTRDHVASWRFAEE